jgi:muramoyltetrapeptide carboxypeptidase LdcA involved in peptidoglycan recycling
MQNLNALTLRADFPQVRAIVLGRFQPESGITREHLRRVVAGHEKLWRIPVIGGVDFGHTTPRITFPVGGKCRVDARASSPSITIIEH